MFKTPVSTTLMTTASFEAPKSERLPKVSFLIITMGLKCRSARLFIGSIDGLSRKTNSSLTRSRQGGILPLLTGKGEGGLVRDFAGCYSSL
ncbi:hypothetical protein M1N79_04735, partial [Dehalococcoidia bacterium]|nr:hypothetical protein [Dehalococcoidia bacterium]